MSEPTPEEIAAAHLYGVAVNTPPSSETAAAINERLEKGDLPRRKIRKREPVTASGENDTVPEPLQLPRQFVVDMHRMFGQLLDEDVPPPGNTRKQLPDHVLTMLAPRVYLSTACEMAVACMRAIVRHPEHTDELEFWAKWLHEEQCRLNNKYSGALCVCPCHETGEES